MPVNDNCYGKHLELKTCEEKLETFKIVRRQVNWDYPDERGAFFYVFWRLSVGWTHCLPDLHDYFQQDQIDWLIEELAESIEDGDFESLVDFIILTGYKDQPELDESGRPSPRRTTPIHRAAKQRGFMAKSLFKIFNRFDLNYADADGYTHLHVACQYGYPEIVEKFLEAGHDPNCVDRSTGNTPLLSHLSNINVRQDILRMLLESGADPNAANALGATPLHVIGTRFGHNFDAESLVDLFFRINDRLQRNVQIDARDNRGRSPLQCAVERLEADVVDALMARGAELTGLVFPSEAHFDGFLGSNDVELRHGRNLIYAAAMLHIVERFEERGYELNRSEAATVMKMFVKYVFNDKPPRLHYRPIVSYKPIRLIGDDETRFLERTKRMIIRPNLTFHDMILLLREGLEPEEPLGFKDYYKFALWYTPWCSGGTKEAAVTRLCERMSRKIFLQWAMDPFMEVTRYRLPILCCKMIIEELSNEDLCNIGVAAQGLA